MVSSKIQEREQHQFHAQSSVAASLTRQQQLITPVLVIPYRVKQVRLSGFANDSQAKEISEILDKKAFIKADRVDSVVSIDNQQLLKGIYKIPIYSSDIQLTAQFKKKDIQHKLTLLKNLRNLEAIDTPFLMVSISDMRGIDNEPQLSIDGNALNLKPGGRGFFFKSGLHAEISKNDLVNFTGEELNVELNLTLRGMEEFSILPVADHTQTQLSSNWPHPQFLGSQLPKERNISDAGFTADWRTNRFSNNSSTVLERCIEQLLCEDIAGLYFGVNFIDPVDVYLQTERALKYAILFIGLSFITFFIFEHVGQQRIHPIQYTLVGLAIATFYLLLVSLGEHMALGWAYLIGALSCTGLLLGYVRYVFGDFRYGLMFCGALLSLNGVLYVIIQAEDFALLMGALLVFFVLGVLMWVTRKVDWYGVVGR